LHLRPRLAPTHIDSSTYYRCFHHLWPRHAAVPPLLGESPTTTSSNGIQRSEHHCLANWRIGFAPRPFCLQHCTSFALLACRRQSNHRLLSSEPMVVLSLATPLICGLAVQSGGPALQGCGANALAIRTTTVVEPRRIEVIIKTCCI
jgi:hypothetical protein